MNSGGRFILLGGGVVLLLIGIICLRDRVGPLDAPPAFLPGDARVTSGSAIGAGHSPTVLSPDPVSESGSSATTPWRDISPVPQLDLLRTPTYPINAAAPPESSFPQRSAEPTELQLPANSVPATEETDREHRARSGEQVEPAGFEQHPAAVTPPVNELRADPRGEAGAAGYRGTMNPEMPRLEVADELKLAPPSEATTVVITREGDSLWHVSEQAYGTGLYYRALFALNRNKIPNPDRMAAGIRLETPPLAELRQLFPSLCPGGA